MQENICFTLLMNIMMTDMWVTTLVVENMAILPTTTILKELR
jgi:hypothetical protein